MYKKNFFRAVKVLPEVVKIGEIPEKEDKAPTETQKDNQTNTKDFSFLSQQELEQKIQKRLEKEISKIKQELQQQVKQEYEKEYEALKSSLYQEIEKERQKAKETAESILNQAKKEAEDLKKTAQQQGYEEGYKNGRENGYKEGYEKGLNEVKQKFNEALQVIQTVSDQIKANEEQLLSSIEPKIVRILEFMLSRLLRKEISLDNQTVLRTLKEIFTRISDKEEITVYLNPKDLKTFEEAQSTFADELRFVKKLSLVADEYIQEGGCIVETRLGSYDARIKSQLEQISQEIEKILYEGYY